MTLTEELEQLRYAADCPVSGTPEDSMALWAKLEEAYRSGRLVEKSPEVERGKWSMDVGLEMVRDAERYRALRDSGIAVSAWQDVGGVHWAVNGTEYINLDDGADALLSRHQPQSSEDK